MGAKILVCGGRQYGRMIEVRVALDMIHTGASGYAIEGIELVVHGDAVGADKLGREWAVQNGIHHAAVPALWDAHGKKAGFLRNQAMLLLQPDMVVAFPGGRGTENMVRLAESAGIPVWRPYG